jgi:hypothetical protein
MHPRLPIYLTPLRFLLGLGLSLAGCAEGTPAPGAGAADAAAGEPDGPGPGLADAAPGTPDATPLDADTVVPVDGAPGDAAPDAALPDAALPDAGTGPLGDHLLLTEIVLAPANGEMIEIYNPTGDPVSLSDYYLTDVNNYYLLPAGVSAGTSDFVVRFPATASLGAHQVATVAIGSSAGFATAYGIPPTYSIGAATGTAVAMIHVDVGTTATLTNDGELIALFRWNGTSDLVADVDLVNAGVPTGANLLVGKTGVAVDGPDGNSATTAYHTDVGGMGVQGQAPDSGLSTKRILPEYGHETEVGTGNGVTGDDETTEQIGVTWDHDPYTAATPGQVPATLLP